MSDTPVQSNGVQPETLKFADLEVISDESKIIEARRNPDGIWTLVLDVDVRLRHPDGRELRFNAEVHTRGRQRGRKPRAQEARPRTRRTK